LQKEEGNLCGLRSGEQEEDVVGRTISWKIRLPVDRGETNGNFLEDTISWKIRLLPVSRILHRFAKEGIATPRGSNNEEVCDVGCRYFEDRIRCP
jgi:hypothetical protein